MKTNSPREDEWRSFRKKKERRRRRGKGSRNREIVSKILSDRNSVDTAVSSKYDVVYIQHGVEDYNIDS